MPRIPDPVLQLTCHDASLAVKPVFDRFQPVIITSGTLSPIDPYPRLPNFIPVVSRSFTMSLTRNSICPMILTRGSEQLPVSTRYDMRSDPVVARNYERLLLEMVSIVPDGIVRFFVSYSYMDSIVNTWNETGILKDIMQHKLVFFETRDVVETTLALDNFSLLQGYSRERCTLTVISLSRPSIPLETLEKLAIVESKWSRSIEELCKLDHIEEAAVLSTCSRFEIYVVALCRDRGVSQVTGWISKSSGVPVSEICKHRVVLYNKDAVEHLFQVASGLDLLETHTISYQLSMVQQLGRGVAGFGPMMYQLFKQAEGLAPSEMETSIDSAGAIMGVSVSSAAVDLAAMKLSEYSSSLATARIMVIGAGKIGRLVIRHLVDRGCKKIVLVTSCFPPFLLPCMKVLPCMKLQEDVEIICKPVSEMYECAATAHMVFTCTNSERPLFLKQDVEELPPAHYVDDVGGAGLRLFFDFAVPRNVGSCVDSLGTAKVYNVDDLKQVLEAGALKVDCLREATKARPIVHEQTKQFEDWRDSLGMASTADLVAKKRAELEEIDETTEYHLDKLCTELKKTSSESSLLETRLSEFGGDITEAQRKSYRDSNRNKIMKHMLAVKQRPYQKLPLSCLTEALEWI